MSLLKLLRFCVTSIALLLLEPALAASLDSRPDITIQNTVASPKKESGFNYLLIPVPGKNYEIGAYNVTQAEWRAIMGNNPSHFAHCGDNCPVEMVSWNDVQEFIQKLNSMTGKQYRLPTETEWEYACNGGDQAEYCKDENPNSISLQDIELRDNTQNTTYPVGQKPANGYGLYDMNGNVWQWMSDCRYGNCSRHKLRGGSWYDVSQYLSAPFRFDIATNRDSFIGFRLARTILPAMITIPGKNYELGKYDVTQGEWRAVMGSNPSHFSSCGDNCPVEMVSWNDAQEFIKKLNTMTGRRYRLPTEAEWEYACYGGNKTNFCGGNKIDSVAWYRSNSSDTTHPVGQKKANGYGLYDMSGNVWQWMDDCWYGECTKHALRGGSWVYYPQILRSTFRYFVPTNIRLYNIGIRLARTLP